MNKDLVLKKIYSDMKDILNKDISKDDILKNIEKMKNENLKLIESKLNIYKNYNDVENEKLAYRMISDRFDTILEKNKRIKEFKNRFSKIVFIKTNEIYTDNYDINQLSITVADTLEDITFKDALKLDRHYYTNKKYHKMKDITKSARKETKAKYARYFKNDKKNILKKIGKIDNKTLIVTFNSKHIEKTFPELLNSEAILFDLFKDTAHNMRQECCPFMPLANTFKIFYDQELLCRTSYYIAIMQKVFYTYIYEKGFDDIDFDNIKHKDNYLTDTEFRDDYLESLELHKINKDLIICYDKNKDLFYCEESDTLKKNK